MRKLNRYLFCFFVLLMGIAFFTRNDLHGVQEILPAVIKQPDQFELTDQSEVHMVRNDYDYVLIPLYGYEINALIVSKIDYRAFTIYKIDKTFHVDLCLIWGHNAESKVFQAEGISFSQDCRWCWVNWKRPVDLRWEEFSNNHLLAKDPVVEKKIKSFHVGDQVRLKGKLVNVKAKLVGKSGGYDSSEAVWKTSVNRTDRGAGACEVFYVEEAELLKPANIIAHFLFRFSMLGVLGCMLWSVVSFFQEISNLMRPPPEPTVTL